MRRIAAPAASPARPAVVPGRDFADHCVELLAPLGSARSRRMFGGFGLYLDDLFVAVIAGERLFLKTDASSEGHFLAAGGEPFVYEAKGRAVKLGFHTVPEAALESPAEMAPWARLACQAALKAALSKASAAAVRPARAGAAAPTKAAATKPASKAAAATKPPSSATAASGRRDASRRSTKA